MGVRSRLTGSFAANGFGYVITILVQFASVPILLIAWGPALYGEWLLASTIPGYLAMSDLGLGSALSNEMALAVSRNDREAAIAAFQSIGLVLLLLGPLVFALVFLSLTQLPISSMLGIKLISPDEFVSLIGLLLVQVWLGQQSGVISAGFRCAGHYPLSIFLANLSRLLEFLAFAMIAYMGRGPIEASIALIMVRTFYLIGMGVLLRLMVPWLRFGTNAVRTDIIKSLAQPGIGFLMLPIANAANLQTPLLIIGALFGANAVATFAIARTISRAIQQLMNIVNISVWPEISIAFGARNFEMLKRLFRLSVIGSIWAGLSGAVILAIFGPSLYRLWTHHLVTLDPILFGLLLTVMVVNTSWYTASVVLAAVNKSVGFACAYLLANLATAPICYVLGLFEGMPGIAAGLIFCEVAIAFYVIPAACHLAHDSPLQLASCLLNPKEFVRLLGRSPWRLFPLR